MTRIGASGCLTVVRHAQAFLAALSAVVVPQTCSAVEAAIRSGEHAEFSRFVISFDDLPEWSLAQTEGELRLRFDVGHLDVDLSRVFEKVPRTRVSNMRIEGDSLVFDLNCACAADAVRFGSDSLIVDVANGPPIPDRADPLNPNLPLSVPTGYLPTALGIQTLDTRFELPKAVADVAVPARPSKPPSPSAEERARRPLDAADKVEPFAVPSVPRLPPGLSLGALGLGYLAEALSDAAALGIADSSPAPETLSREPDLSDIPGLSVRTVFDEVTAPGTVPSIRDTSCIADSRLDLTAWSREHPDGPGRIRGRLHDEKGRVVAQSIAELSRFYVSRGFGAEARSAQMNLPEDVRDAVILAIAEIVDNGETDIDVFAKQINCSNAAALWSAMSGPIDPTEIGAGNPAILRTFSSLPPSIRLQIGHRLSDRLREVGLSKDASVVLNSVARSGDLGAPDYRLAASRIGLGGSDTRDAIARLETLVESTNPTAAKALLALFEHAETENVEPRPSWIDNAESLVRASRGDPDAERLRILWLRGLVGASRFQTARDAVFRHRRHLDAADRAALQTELIAKAAESADDATLLELLILVEGEGSIARLAPPARAQLGERLAVLGLLEAFSFEAPPRPTVPDHSGDVPETSAGMDLEHAETPKDLVDAVRDLRVSLKDRLRHPRAEN